MIRLLHAGTWLLAAGLAFVACDATELDDNLIDPNNPNPEAASLEFVYNGVELAFEDFLAGAVEGPGDNLNNNTGVGVYGRLNPLIRYISMGGGNTYNNAFTAVDYDFIWRKAYSEVLPDIQLVKQIARERNQTTAIGIALVYEAMTYMTLVDMFGDVPYEEALQGQTNQNPTVSPGAVVYDAAINLLDSAIANLAAPVGSVDYDLFYGGDAGKWGRAAQSLKLKALLNLRLVDAGRAKAGIQAIVDSAAYITDRSGDFAFPYSQTRSSFNSRSTDYSNNYETGAADYIGNSFLYDLLTDYAVADPRLRYYVYRQDIDATNEDFFTLECQALSPPRQYGPDQPFCTADAELGYWGRDHGNNDGIPPDDLKRTVVGIYPAGGAFDDDSAQGLAANNGEGGARGAGILPIMLSPFVTFMRAEAALTLQTEADPRALLLQAVEESMMSVHAYALDFGAVIPDEYSLVADSSTIDDYLEAIGEAYDAAGDEDGRLEVIGSEYYKALWLNGLEAYNLYRRTGTPNDLQPTRTPSSGDFPRTVLYPNDPVTLNTNIKQHPLTTQVFWDNNPAGFID